MFNSEAPNNELTNGGGRGMVEEQALMRPSSNGVLAVKKSPSKDLISHNGENALSTHQFKYGLVTGLSLNSHVCNSSSSHELSIPTICTKRKL
ncbi:hypothetical protein Pyn_05653 [Prunus yedoensis var. nudiflora]|uniref:Uncharacterized protein n=1 Tax=Prunus yedoensis var. nudiflora TaxID=2094558 RepID=A0A314UC30_PRUYE|nr:hypothetical protein Pyn_05653 [Prunus yedoensis var. nudiflora]